MKYILPALILIISFSGCKKKDVDETPVFELVLIRNGVEEKFNPYYSWITAGSIPGSTKFIFTSRSLDGKNEFHLGIQVDGEIKTGIYNSGNLQYWVNADYFLNIADQDVKGYTITPAPGLPASSFTVNITKVDEKYIKGSFTGNYLYDINYDEIIEVTEGRFTVKRR